MVARIRSCFMTRKNTRRTSRLCHSEEPTGDVEISYRTHYRHQGKIAAAAPRPRNDGWNEPSSYGDSGRLIAARERSGSMTRNPCAERPVFVMPSAQRVGNPFPGNGAQESGAAHYSAFPKESCAAASSPSWSSENLHKSANIPCLSHGNENSEKKDPCCTMNRTPSRGQRNN